MNIHAVQLDTAWQDRPANFAKVSALLDAARPEPESLIVLPEMFATGFTMDVAAMAETDDGPTRAFLCDTAARYGAWVIAGLPGLGTDGRGRNLSAVFDGAGAPAAEYCKLHPFSYADETDHYAPGDKLVTLRLGEFAACPLICYDLRFPEVFRIATGRGAQLFVVIANWPRPRAGHWRALLIARAIENQAFVVGVNRCGRDPDHDYGGGSMIVDPRGAVVAEADDREAVLSAEIRLDSLLAWREEFPGLDDIRTDYDDL